MSVNILAIFYKKKVTPLHLHLRPQNMPSKRLHSRERQNRLYATTHSVFCIYDGIIADAAIVDA